MSIIGMYIHNSEIEKMNQVAKYQLHYLTVTRSYKWCIMHRMLTDTNADAQRSFDLPF